MKIRRYICALLIASPLLMSAQLQAPTEPVDPVEPAAQEESAPQKQAKYNTPSKSYKDERNAIRRGNKLFKEEKYHQALEEYERALDINEGSIRARFNKAVALLELQSDDNKGTDNDPRVKARELFSGIISDAKAYDRIMAEKAYYNLGNMAYNDEDYRSAIEFYKSSLRINPDNMDTRENLRRAQLKLEEQQNQDQNQDQQDQQDQQEQQQQEQQQQEQQQQEQEQQQQQQQQQPQPMTNSAQQILQSMQNKENATRKKVQAEEPSVGRPKSDKPW